MKASSLVKTIYGRKLLRKKAHAKPCVSIILVDGNTSPTLKGNSFYYKTNGGRIIYKPNAYAKKAWSNMNYIPSTIRVEVGKDYSIEINCSSKLEYLIPVLLDLNINTYYDYETKKYSISGEDISYKDLSLLEYKLVAAKILKLKSFL